MLRLKIIFVFFLKQSHLGSFVCNLGLPEVWTTWVMEPDILGLIV